jgi:hypothetical protein
MIKWSVIFGIFGIFVSGMVKLRLGSWASHQKPQHYWLLGVAALFPAWLITFIALFDTSVGKGPDAPAPVSAVLSSSVALIGIIFTEALVRHLDRSGRVYRATIYWLLGVGTLLPGWGIGLLALMRK